MNIFVIFVTKESKILVMEWKSESASSSTTTESFLPPHFSHREVFVLKRQGSNCWVAIFSLLSENFHILLNGKSRKANVVFEGIQRQLAQT